MAVNPEIQLTERQVALLRKVVEDYVLSGRPVGSKILVERSGLRISSSTVRSELAELEEVGLLTHPHTSAGRVPTERGYRFYVDQLLTRLEPRPSPFPLDLTEVRSEVEEALQATTEMVSQVTHLLTLVSAPALATTTVRHVEVLASAAARRGGRRDHLDRAMSESASSSSPSRSTRGSSHGRPST